MKKRFLNKEEFVRFLYRNGIPTYGEKYLDKEIYDYLRSEGKLLEKITPKVIKEKYLADKTYVEVKKIYEAFLKTPGELRLVSKKAFIESIKDGVKTGLFGYGYLKDGKVECKYINEIPMVNDLEDNAAIVKREMCIKEETSEVSEVGIPSQEIKETGEQEEIKPQVNTISKIYLKLRIPTGQMATITRVVNYLKNKFNLCDVQIIIRASNGEMRVSDYEDKVMEAIKQGGIEIEEENKE